MVSIPAPSSSLTLADVTLRVRDLALVEDFYQSILGFDTLERSASRAALATKGSSSPLLVLEASRDAKLPGRASAGLFHTAFLYPNRAALGSMLRHLLSRGLRFGAGDHAVSEALYFNDPEGNGIELYADRPRSDWPLQADGSVEMVTEAVNLSSLVEAGSEAGIPAAMAQARIGHIHLSVSNLERAETLYSKLLGLEARQRSFPGALFLARDGYHHHLGLNTWQARVPRDPASTGLLSFQMRLSAPAFDSLAASDSPALKKSGAGQLSLSDPEGWLVQVTRQNP